MSFAEVKKNFGFGCMRLPMQGEEVAWHSLARWWTNTWRRDSIALIPRGFTWAAKVSPPAPSICPSANT